MTAWRRRVIRTIKEQRSQRGQSLVEAALALPLLLIVALGVIQFALYEHAENVAAGAAQEGARVAAAEDGTLAGGVERSESILQAGLGSDARNVSVQAAESADTVSITVHGRLPVLIPWVTDASLPLSARASMTKEQFSVGPTH
jgi:Flp pilus assembly protein TadG